MSEPSSTEAVQAHATVTTPAISRRSDLVQLAVAALTAHGLAPDFSAAALAELASIARPAQEAGPNIRDLRALPWCSIDDDDSQDIDQLSCCEPSGSGWTVSVAIADVDALVHKGSAIDLQAQRNTTSVYTAARVFPMLPERLSTDLSSLGAHQDRLAIVTAMVVDGEGQVSGFTVCRAQVRNQAKLAYDAVSAWIEGVGDLPDAARAVPGMDEQLRTQDAVAQRMRARRREQGALDLETFQPRAVFEGERVVDIVQQVQNRARQLIEEFMIATNTCTAQFLAQHGASSLRRVVRSPERWQRIVEVAAKYGEHLPSAPDSRALEGFLARRRKADPLRFPDLSLVIVKLMGSGEYVVERPRGEPIGHFGLAVRDYTHSTAPNRRYPDLITLRMVKALLQGEHSPYGAAELELLAEHCTQQEDAAQKVERSVRKSEAALYLQGLVGRKFDAVVTGATDRATWVRIFVPPAEGMLVGAGTHLDVGQKLRVKLVATNVERGFIDFEQIA